MVWLYEKIVVLLHIEIKNNIINYYNRKENNYDKENYKTKNY